MLSCCFIFMGVVSIVNFHIILTCGFWLLYRHGDDVNSHVVSSDPVLGDLMALVAVT